MKNKISKAYLFFIFCITLDMVGMDREKEARRPLLSISEKKQNCELSPFVMMHAKFRIKAQKIWNSRAQITKTLKENYPELQPKGLAALSLEQTAQNIAICFKTIYRSELPNCQHSKTDNDGVLHEMAQDEARSFILEQEQETKCAIL